MMHQLWLLSNLSRGSFVRSAIFVRVAQTTFQIGSSRNMLISWQCPLLTSLTLLPLTSGYLVYGDWPTFQRFLKRLLSLTLITKIYDQFHFLQPCPTLKPVVLSHFDPGQFVFIPGSSTSFALCSAIECALPTALGRLLEPL